MFYLNLLKIEKLKFYLLKFLENGQETYFLMYVFNINKKLIDIK